MDGRLTGFAAGSLGFAPHGSGARTRARVAAEPTRELDAPGVAPSRGRPTSYRLLRSVQSSLQPSSVCSKVDCFRDATACPARATGTELRDRREVLLARRERDTAGHPSEIKENGGGQSGCTLVLAHPTQSADRKRELLQSAWSGAQRGPALQQLPACRYRLGESSHWVLVNSGQYSNHVSGPRPHSGPHRPPGQTSANPPVLDGVGGMRARRVRRTPLHEAKVIKHGT